MFRKLSADEGCAECRYDVILTANAEPRTYYVVAQPQYRAGAPAGYGFLTYSNSNVTMLPPTPTPAVNATAPWTVAQTLAVPTPSLLSLLTFMMWRICLLHVSQHVLMLSCDWEFNACACNIAHGILRARPVWQCEF